MSGRSIASSRKKTRSTRDLHLSGGPTLFPSSTSGVLDGRVLVVDDDVNFHRLAEAALGELGVECVCVRSSEEAQRLLTGSVPRAVLVDGLLPGVRGDEFARRLRSRYPQKVLPIVFISAFYRDMKSYKLLTRDCGVDLVLHKPITPAQLTAALGKLLRFDPPAVRVEVGGDEEGEEEVEIAGIGEGDGAGGAQAAEAADADAGKKPQGASGASVADEFNTPELMRLRAEYLAESRERAQELRAALNTLSGPGAEDALHMIRVEAHRFRGSGNSFGFPEISRLAGLVEDLILQNENVLRNGHLRARLTGLVEALADKVLVAAGSAPVILDRRFRGALHRVLLVDRVDTPLARAAAAAAEKGQPIDVVSDLDAAAFSAIEMRPDVIFVACDQGFDLEESCQRLQVASSAPIVVIAKGGELNDWVKAVRVGATGYVARPAEAETLFRHAALFAKPRASYNVVAVGGDRASLSGLAELLAPRGVAVEPCASAEEFFASLERATPSLVILDGDLQPIRGIDLLKVLRADAAHRRVPVVVVSRVGAMHDRVAAYEAGAVDWVARPVHPEELVTRVLAQLARARGGDESGQWRGRDPVTGLYDRAYLLDACGRALQLARREGRTVSLLAIEVELEGLRREMGRLACDEVMMALGAQLTASFRNSDVIARVAPSRVVALLHGAGREDAERLLAAELERFRSRRFLGGWEPRASGRVVVFPEQTGTAEELLRAAEGLE